MKRVIFHLIGGERISMETERFDIKDYRFDVPTVIGKEERATVIAPNSILYLEIGDV